MQAEIKMLLRVTFQIEHFIIQVFFDDLHNNIFVLHSVDLDEYNLNSNSKIEVCTRTYDFHIIIGVLIYPFLWKNLDC